ncbi:nucleotidyltransferase [Bacillus sp. B1-b2]|uniref:nucleotidyltransferase n=1 Tax=Bacillus sp. B1-b2 TaxID=2653201 RepID=UPI0012627B25|nr:nucleotidyltransferase [Bacillus sp. B1-b2]KAB7669280.1 nucleotidyltransferase [Bacillus sp. B1-b2]
MKAVGIIVEYNPLHNGHLHHVQQAREKSNADIVIAVMSGPFLQRGEPAIVSKWARTNMALEAGIDMVIELPYSFATQHAEVFASGAVDLLNSMLCDYVCFGSESGNINDFKETYEFLALHQQEENDLVKQYIKKGYSYPKARSFALEELNKRTSVKTLDLQTPNNILGFEYYKAVQKGNYKMEVLTIPRKLAGYHDEVFTSDTIASATSIRKELGKHKNMMAIQPYLPKSTYSILQTYRDTYHTYHTWENYWPYLKFRLLQLTAQELSHIFEIEEGLEHRLLKFAKEAQSFQAFLTAIKTKRYTWTRLQRVCLHILTNTTKAEMKAVKKPAYIRLLGMTKKGRDYLKENKKNFLLPMLSKISSFQHDQLELDIRASHIYALGAPITAQQSLLEMDFKQPPIMKE